MERAIEQIGTFIETHHAWAGPVIALLAMGESLVLVGFFIPATVLMLATGGLIGGGALAPLPVLAWAVGGAVAGDAVSYWLGRWAGPGLMRRGPLRTRRRAVARARLFFSRYGFASIVAGRFLGPLRCIVPTVAGVMGMGHLSFQLANVLSAIAWVPLMLAPGYLAARGLHAAADGQRIGLIAGSAAAAALGLWLLATLLRRRRQPAGTEDQP